MRRTLELLAEAQEAYGDEDSATGVVCLAWRCCHHPELCQNECFDRDLTAVAPAAEAPSSAP